MTEIPIASAAAGEWRLAGAPRFDRRTGRFEGLAGVARREQASTPSVSASDSLRQLVHELRTPANAIAGFAELIGTELRGTRIDDTVGLAAAILEHAEVAVVPGEAFGTPGFLRLSYALADDDLRTGVERMGALLAEAK